MSVKNPMPWRCAECLANDGFAVTVDRLLHVTRGHIGKVVDADGNLIDVQRGKVRT